ncbi:hypothetical protein GLAREA_01285 [Glarea lozoyensis ATCC 20868]|uniref:Uncharacterized protein n=1 Tax=Glarea lozoyensis (strain ATCC 20868 / MF5171) TaxID=1116229 RepID=S3DFF9_GLAL2|nr:uncharacterized protein GLAREA_01285 [Glarea lozoyensis ATCC 20868]EPE25373.1 hypothetical protein GLAREA_01285 [Glarea lozoyensis ATCC 20868]
MSSPFKEQDSSSTNPSPPVPDSETPRKKRRQRQRHKKKSAQIEDAGSESSCDLEGGGVSLGLYHGRNTGLNPYRDLTNGAGEGSSGGMENQRVAPNRQQGDAPRGSEAQILKTLGTRLDQEVDDIIQHMRERKFSMAPPIFNDIRRLSTDSSPDSQAVETPPPNDLPQPLPISNPVSSAAETPSPDEPAYQWTTVSLSDVVLKREIRVNPTTHPELFQTPKRWTYRGGKLWTRWRRGCLAKNSGRL